jgi:hypothetical protein
MKQTRRTRRAWVAATLILVGTVLPVLSTSAIGARAGGVTWGAEHRFRGFGAQVVVDRSGTVTLAWRDTHDRLAVSRHRSGGRWSDAVRLRRDIRKPAAMVVDEHGTITLAFVGQRGALFVTRRPMGGPWQEPSRLSPPHKEGSDYYIGVFDAALATNTHGDTAAVWSYGSEDVGPGPRVFGSYRPAGGTWSRKVRLAGADRGSFEISVGVDAMGVATAAWDGRGPTVARRVPGHRWGRSVELAPRRRYETDPVVASPPEADPWVLWAARRRDGSGGPVRGAHLRSGASWSRAIPISSPRARAVSADVAVDSLGRLRTAWWQGQGRVVTATRPAGGHWQRPRLLDASRSDVLDLDLAMDGTGRALLAWDSGSYRHVRIEVAYRPTRDPWAEPVTIRRHLDVETHALVALGGHQAAVAYELHGVHVRLGRLP